MKRLAGIAFLTLALSPVTPGATLTVEPNGRAEYMDIQAAIDAAKDGDVVALLPGVYLINSPIDFNRLHDSGDGSTPPLKNIRLLAQGPREETIIMGPADPADPDHAAVVIFRSGETGESQLEGLTLSGGKGSEGGDGDHGGGGILCANGSSPSIVACAIRGNTARVAGGGVRLTGDSSPSFTDCEISGNQAADFGGGVYSGPECSPRFVRSTISGNLSHEGGGLYLAGGSPVLSDSRISGNRSVEHGGGIAIAGTSTPKIVNCVLSGNISGGNGGGAHVSGSASPAITNCTITGNFALGSVPAPPPPDTGGGLFAGDGSSPRLRNTIVWDNLGGGLASPGAPGPDVAFSSVEGEGTWPGAGNLNGDPLFVAPGQRDDGATPDDFGDDSWVEGDYRLQPGSPCIDAGTLEGAPSADISGNGRLCGSGVDMGAHESGDCPSQGPRFRRGDTNADSGLDLSDAVAILGFLFLGTGPPLCLDSADCDDSGTLELTDPILLLNYLFLGNRAPAAPFAECGEDPTPEDIPCERFDACG